MPEQFSAKCSSCGSPEGSAHAPDCAKNKESQNETETKPKPQKGKKIEKKQLSPEEQETKNEEKEKATKRLLERIDEVVQDAFPDDPVKTALYREYLLNGTHGGDFSMDAVAHEKLGEKGWELVDLYGGSSIHVEPGEDPKAFLTNKLNGCVATVVYTESASGARDMAMTHYPPFSKKRNFEDFSALINEDMRGAEKKQVRIMMTEKRSDSADEYRDTLTEILGEDANIDVDFYEPDHTNRASGVMLIDLPSEPDEQPSLNSWEKETTI